MTLFTKAKSTSAFLKMGLLGFQGSGKTKTATKTAIGLVQHMKKIGAPSANKPVYFIDTETGSDWVLPDFEAAGIPVETAKTRAFSDLVQAVPIAEHRAAVLLIDSGTHFWKELCESYCRRKAKALNKSVYRLQINDWGYLKGESGWGKFADLYVNSAVHIILCGRAGYEFNLDEDEEGHKQLEKTGVKMKAEGEFGYEPSLLVYMELHQRMKGKQVVKQWREATVLKDRAALIDGKVFQDPTFEDFLPHIQRLNLGGCQLGVDATRTSASMFPAEARDDRTVQLVLHYPSTSAEHKKKKIELLRTHFEAAWTEIETVMPLERLRKGYDTLHFTLENKHSRYHQAPVPTSDDGIPDFLDRRKTIGATEASFIDLVGGDHG